ncbi:MAG TPA: RNA-guided pseudouridylation complex pseudouridine synthase subunit Cbf5 [Thermoplasmata archaeon]|nr:RNA-guided pseudouridylation complex pseudouridine synthase subunit Cbf5 [Thermoplasmata archaeon]
MSDRATPPFPEPVRKRIASGAFLLIDKPRGPSSHQVTAWVRDLLGVDAAGHAGTLDPNVSGLLWIGVGPALKLIPLLLDFPKRYVGLVRLHGAASDPDLARVLAEFRGPVYQTPPVRSAVRRERRVRTIHRLELLEREDDRLLIDLVGDSGTYVRTLAVDLGEALGVDGHLEELRRTGTGPFVEAASIPLARLADAAHAARSGDPAALLALLHPIEEVTREVPNVLVKDSAAASIAHGSDLASGGILSTPRPFSKGQHVVLVSRLGEVLATGRALVDRDELSHHRHGWVIDAERVLVDPARFSRNPAPKEPAAPAGTDPGGTA